LYTFENKKSSINAAFLFSDCLQSIYLLELPPLSKEQFRDNYSILLNN